MVHHQYPAVEEVAGNLQQHHQNDTSRAAAAAAPRPPLGPSSHANDAAATHPSRPLSDDDNKKKRKNRPDDKGERSLTAAAHTSQPPLPGAAARQRQGSIHLTNTSREEDSALPTTRNEKSRPTTTTSSSASTTTFLAKEQQQPTMAARSNHRHHSILQTADVTVNTCSGSRQCAKHDDDDDKTIGSSARQSPPPSRSVMQRQPEIISLVDDDDFDEDAMPHAIVPRQQRRTPCIQQQQQHCHIFSLPPTTRTTAQQQQQHGSTQQQQGGSESPSSSSCSSAGGSTTSSWSAEMKQPAAKARRPSMVGSNRRRRVVGQSSAVENVKESKKKNPGVALEPFCGRRPQESSPSVPARSESSLLNHRPFLSSCGGPRVETSAIVSEPSSSSLGVPGALAEGKQSSDPSPSSLTINQDCKLPAQTKKQAPPPSVVEINASSSSKPVSRSAVEIISSSAAAAATFGSQEDAMSRATLANSSDVAKLSEREAQLITPAVGESSQVRASESNSSAAVHSSEQQTSSAGQTVLLSGASNQVAAELPQDHDNDMTAFAAAAEAVEQVGPVSYEQFLKLWASVEADQGLSTCDIENGRLVRSANTKISKTDAAQDQRCAQYGRFKPKGVERLIEVTNLTYWKSFIDIGHGIGNVPLQVAYTVGCESRGIEVVGDRHLVAERYADNLADQIRIIRERDNREHCVGDIRLRHGSLQDTEHQEFITTANVAFVNNAHDVFGHRSAKNDNAVTMDFFVAGLFCAMSPGAIMATFGPLDLGLSRTQANQYRKSRGLEESEDAGFFEVEEVELGTDLVTWSCTQGLVLYKYTRVKQSQQSDDTAGAVFLCCNPDCDVARRNELIPAVRLDGAGRYLVNTCECGVTPHVPGRRRRKGTNTRE